jgi:hypothetical protein
VPPGRLGPLLAGISSIRRASGLAVLVIKRLGMIRHLIERPAGW